MDTFLATKESCVESELIDLGAVPMTALRKWDDTALRQALLHVMQRAVHSQVVMANGPERVD